jgi:uncharacterized protein with GYD domain
MVVIIEAPDDSALAAIMLAIGSTGAIRSETLKAFSEGEFKAIIGSLL